MEFTATFQRHTECASPGKPETSDRKNGLAAASHITPDFSFRFWVVKAFRGSDFNL